MARRFMDSTGLVAPHQLRAFLSFAFFCPPGTVPLLASFAVVGPQSSSSSFLAALLPLSCRRGFQASAIACDDVICRKCPVEAA